MNWFQNSSYNLARGAQNKAGRRVLKQILRPILFKTMINKSVGNYKKGFMRYGISPKSMGWKNSKAQEMRFKELTKDLDFEGKSVLDFGCGMGDIVPNLLAKSESFEYTGVDVIKEFIEVAKSRQIIPENLSKKVRVSFLVRDAIKKPLRKKFDIVLCSGALNSNINDAVRYRKLAIKTLWGHAGIALAFNMAGAHPQPKNKKGNRVYYADSLEILKLCFTLTSRIIFRHQYRKRDFTIIMFR